MTNPAPTETDFAALMEEPPVGNNHGSFRYIASTQAHSADSGKTLLGTEDAQATEFMVDGGFGIVETSRGSGGHGTTYGARDAGMTAHRGVLHPDEYVDPDLLRALVAAELGFTVDEIECAYAAGRPTPQRASMRAHIDGRLLALSRSGGNMLELARALGWPVDEDRRRSGDASCRKLERALERAQAAEAEVAA